jgi:RHS repeat-associated protein
MKFLYIIFVVIFISGSFAFSQEEQKDESSYPKFIPYVPEVNNLQANTVNMNIKDYGKEQPARWLSVDPAASKYPGWSPYNYVTNNPLRNIDPNGSEFTTFIDENGKVKNVDDGSNAVFAATGSGTNLHYEYQGMDITNTDGANVINLTTAVQEQQQMNLVNPDLQQHDGNTYCNLATQNVLFTVGSAVQEDINLVGSANTMASNIKSSNYFKPVDSQTADQNAANGGLSIVTYENKADHGHIATYSVGTNREIGQIANIGPKRYTGFVPLNGAINNNKQKEFYIFAIPNVRK